MSAHCLGLSLSRVQARKKNTFLIQTLAEMCRCRSSANTHRPIWCSVSCFIVYKEIIIILVPNTCMVFSRHKNSNRIHTWISKLIATNSNRHLTTNSNNRIVQVITTIDLLTNEVVQRKFKRMSSWREEERFDQRTKHIIQIPVLLCSVSVWVINLS